MYLTPATIAVLAIVLATVLSAVVLAAIGALNHHYRRQTRYGFQDCANVPGYRDAGTAPSPWLHDGLDDQRLTS